MKAQAAVRAIADWVWSEGVTKAEVMSAVEGVFQAVAEHRVRLEIDRAVKAARDGESVLMGLAAVLDEAQRDPKWGLCDSNRPEAGRDA